MIQRATFFDPDELLRLRLKAFSVGLCVGIAASSLAAFFFL